jgi:NAD(P)-dependent dehydrogenase (short-subunit alcohol dehydrogenase family)
MSLQDKVAIVTAGSHDIGRTICLGLAAPGAKVVVAARTEVDTSAGSQFARYASGTVHEIDHSRCRVAGGADRCKFHWPGGRAR